ncbi:hypothetical protein ACT691_00270 [Vibrio metschnikovii]
MQIIREVEKPDVVAMAVRGLFNGDGDLDTCIVIRSAYVGNGIAQVQAALVLFMT